MCISFDGGVRPVSADVVEELPNVTDEQVGLLHGQERTAVSQFGPMRDVVVAVGEAAHGDVARSDGDAGRDGAAVLGAPGVHVVGVVVVEVGGGRGGPGEPVEADVGQ